MSIQNSPPDAATAAVLRREVTIVIGPKDRFSTTQSHLEKLRQFAPGVRILHTLCGPMPRQTRAFLEERARADPDLELIDMGRNFVNPYEMRNLALQRVRSKYVMFAFNDVEPLNDRWLAALHHSAETHPDVDVFQPFIWEGSEAPHATWIALWFLRHGGELHCEHPNGPVDVPHDPAALPEKEQPYFLEDHAFFARTAFLASQSILDPGAAYTRDYLDMALTMRFRGARIWSVPSCQVIYAVPYRMQPGDLLYFCHRRSWSVSRGSIEYIQRKWGFHYWDDAYSRAFIDKQLGSASWSGADVPTDQLEQVEMMLGVFTAAGYDCFEALQADAPAGKALSPLPAAHRRLGEMLRHGERRVAMEMRHIGAVGVYPDFDAHFEARREALRAGKLFPIVENAEAGAAMLARGARRMPARFAMLEIDGIRGTETGVVEALKPHACLIARERNADGTTGYRAWLHGVFRFKRDLESLAAAVADGVGHDLRLAGRTLAGARARLHQSHDQGAHAMRIVSDAASAGWRLVHCAWRPNAADDLIALLR